MLLYLQSYFNYSITTRLSHIHTLPRRTHLRYLVAHAMRLNRQILPVFLLAVRQFDVELDPGPLQPIMALRRQGIVAQIDQLQRVRIDHALVRVHLDDVVVVGQQLLQLGHLEHDLGQGDEGVVGDVEAAQRSQVGQLVGKFGHLIVGQVEHWQI